MWAVKAICSGSSGGGEDPGTWADFAAIRQGNVPPGYGKIVSLGNTDVEGAGEILTIDAPPSPSAFRFGPGKG